MNVCVRVRVRVRVHVRERVRLQLNHAIFRYFLGSPDFPGLLIGTDGQGVKRLKVYVLRVLRAATCQVGLKLACLQCTRDDAHYVAVIRRNAFVV